MPHIIRQYREHDAPLLADLCLASIIKIGPQAYNPAQISAWASRHPGASLYQERTAKGAHIFVAVEGAESADIPPALFPPLAYALLEPSGHLDRLYCHPDHTGKGLASALLQEAENFARLNLQEVNRLFTEASEIARPAFAKAGYVVTHRRDFEIGNIPIHNYAMEKDIS